MPSPISIIELLWKSNDRFLIVHERDDHLASIIAIKRWDPISTFHFSSQGNKTDRMASNVLQQKTLDF